MEKIQQALDKATQDRAESVKRTNEPNASSVDSISDERIGHQPAIDVRYKRTKRIEISTEIFLRNRLVVALPQHELGDSYRMLRTRVLQSMRENAWSSLAVTGPSAGSGKTLTAINLAMSLALEVVHTVLLVDLNLRRPSVHRFFEHTPQYGLSDYLLNDVPIEEILFTPSIDRLVILPGRESIHNSSEMLGSPKMIALVNELKTRYPDRLVIFDLPPMLTTDDTLAFSPHTNAMLMVVENGVTTAADLEKAISILGDTPLIGTVLNRADLADPKPQNLGD